MAQVPTTTEPTSSLDEVFTDAASQPWMPIALVVGTVMLAFLLVHLYRRHSGRSQAIAKVAAAHGLSFSDIGGSALTAVRFSSFAGGDGVDLVNMVSGHAPDGASVSVFDYAVWSEFEVRERERTGFTWTSRDDAGAGGVTTRRSTVGAVRTGAAIRVQAYLPRLTVGPETMSTRAVDAFGGRDIQLESDEFNRLYDVRGPDRDFARLFLDAQVITTLLTTEGAVSLETFGNWILVTTPLAAPGDFPGLLGFAVALRDAVPDLVGEMYPDATDAEMRPGFRLGGGASTHR